MEGAEVVNRTQEIHAGLDSLGAASQSPCTTGQKGQALAESGVESFDEGGVDAATNTLTIVNEGLNHLCTTLDNSSTGLNRWLRGKSYQIENC